MKIEEESYINKPPAFGAEKT